MSRISRISAVHFARQPRSAIEVVPIVCARARAIFSIALHDYPPARRRQLCRGLVVQRYRTVLFVAMSRAILSTMSTNFITYC
jgi:hypothetical protein